MLRVISLGAGVQSSTLFLMACEGVLAPKPNAAIFADTQWEPREVYQWLGELARIGALYGIPVIQATRVADEARALAERIIEITGGPARNKT